MRPFILETITWGAMGFITWNVFSLFICLTGLGLERGFRGGNPVVRSTLLRATLLLSLIVPAGCLFWNSIPQSFKDSQPVATVVSPNSAKAALPISNLNWELLAVWRPAVSTFIEVKRFSPDYLDVFSDIFLGASLLGSAFLTARLVSGLWVLSTLSKHGLPSGISESNRCKQVAANMGLPAPLLLALEFLESPVLIGLFRPVIMVPAGMEARDEMYTHELTHFRRHDLWWHLLVKIATILMPLQPGLWRLNWVMEACDEDVCDDAVLISGADREAYARLLLDVAESQNQAIPEFCLPMASFRSQLGFRLTRLLDTARPLTDRLCLSSLGLRLTPLLFVVLLGAFIYMDSAHMLFANTPTSAPESPTTSTTPTAKDIISDARKAYDSLTSYSSTGEAITVTGDGKTLSKTKFTIRLQRSNLYRISWGDPTEGSITGFGAVWSDGSGDYLSLSDHDQKMASQELALGAATGVSQTASATIPGTFFNQPWGNALNPETSSQRMPDDVVETVDCYVILEHITANIKTVLWIGKLDHLIHKSQMVVDKSDTIAPSLSDDQIKEALKTTNQTVTSENIAKLKSAMGDANKLLAQQGPILITQIQRDIVVNTKFTPADFKK